MGLYVGAAVDNLHFIDGQAKTKCKLKTREITDGAQYCLFQDNGLKHTSRVAKLWLIYNSLKLIETPAQSP